MTIPKVTSGDIERAIKETRYHVDGTLTIAIVEMNNGFKVTGESACMNPADYCPDTGRQVARRRAVDKLFSLMGYARMDDAHRSPQFFWGDPQALLDFTHVDSDGTVTAETEHRLPMFHHLGAAADRDEPEDVVVHCTGVIDINAPVADAA